MLKFDKIHILLNDLILHIDILSESIFFLSFLDSNNNQYIILYTPKDCLQQKHLK